MQPASVDAALFYRFGIALIIGLLVGLQREFAYVRQGHHEEELFAGARTFALIGLFGCGSAYVSMLMASPLPFVVLFLVFGVLVSIAYYLGSRDGDIGLTTEIAALLTFLTGALCAWDKVVLAAALGVGLAVILAIKVHTTILVRRITLEDVYATLKFAVITAIVLPLLPKEGIGPAPFDVLSPYRIWLMVVFISGISFLGYLLMKLVGTRRGVGLAGILGGLASSTAVSLSFSQHSRRTQGLGSAFALAILLSWTVMFVRILVEVLAVNRALLARLQLPILAVTGIMLAYCGWLFFRANREQASSDQKFTNPFELRPALTFGALYAVILVVSNAARQYFGAAGIYVSSVVSGVADVDAITLSMAELSRESGLDHGIASQAIVLAAASNTLVKGAIVLAAGSPELRRAILPGLVLSVSVALAAVFLL